MWVGHGVAICRAGTRRDNCERRKLQRGKALSIYILFLWLVLPAPGDPVLGHRGDDAMVLGLYWLGVGDLVEGVEPVVGALGQPVQQPRGGVGADVDDGLVGVVSRHLGDVYAPGALFEPFVGQAFEFRPFDRHAGVDFGDCAGCGRDSDWLVTFSVGAGSAHICSGSWLCFGWSIPAAGMGVSIGRMWPRLSKLSQHWADGAHNIASVRPFLQLSSLRDKDNYRASKVLQTS